MSLSDSRANLYPYYKEGGGRKAATRKSAGSQAALLPYQPFASCASFWKSGIICSVAKELNHGFFTQSFKVYGFLFKRIWILTKPYLRTFRMFEEFFKSNCDENGFWFEINISSSGSAFDLPSRKTLSIIMCNKGTSSSGVVFIQQI